jgi:hypothetical protein
MSSLELQCLEHLCFDFVFYKKSEYGTQNCTTLQLHSRLYNLVTMPLVVFSDKEQFKQGTTQRVFFESKTVPYVQPVFVYSPHPYGVMVPVVRDACASYNDNGEIVAVNDIIGVATPRSFTRLSVESGVLQATSFAMAAFDSVPIAVQISTSRLEYDVVCKFKDESGNTLYMFGNKMVGKHEGDILFSDGEILPFCEIKDDCTSVNEAFPIIILKAFANLFLCDSKVCEKSMFVDVDFHAHTEIKNIILGAFKGRHAEVQLRNLQHVNLGAAATGLPERLKDIMVMYMASAIRTECIHDVVKKAICNFVPPALPGTDPVTSIVLHHARVLRFDPEKYDHDDSIIDESEEFPGIEHNVIEVVTQAMEDMVPPEIESNIVQDDSDLPVCEIEEDDKDNVEFARKFHYQQEMIIVGCAKSAVAGDAMFCVKPEFKRNPVRISKRKVVSTSEPCKKAKTPSLKYLD